MENLYETVKNWNCENLEAEEGESVYGAGLMVGAGEDVEWVIS